MGRTGRAVSFHAALAPDSRQGALAVFVSGFVGAGRISRAVLVWLFEQKGGGFPLSLLNAWLFVMGKTAAQRETQWGKLVMALIKPPHRRFCVPVSVLSFFRLRFGSFFLLKSSRLPAADPLCNPPTPHPPLPAAKGFPRTKAPLPPHTHPPSPPQRAANGLTKRGKQPLHSLSPHCIRWCRRLG